MLNKPNETPNALCAAPDPPVTIAVAVG
ncbi:hypothetical protein A2U01_0064180, partial [Trifolium medium]|nr:hypothetical protein [Trifolium medium]